jgi:MFS superfamily sulfate permease-like transporter
MTEQAQPTGRLAAAPGVRGWRAVFPPAQWLATYQAKRLRNDAVAGVTLAAYGIPVSLAYASLAGLPPQYGVYCYMLGGLFYALFGSSRQLAIGPTSAISMLVGATVAGMAGGDPQRWASIAALTALLVAAMCVVAWLLKLSTLVDFISETILVGFKAGAAFTIALTQLPKLFGVKGAAKASSSASSSSAARSPTPTSRCWPSVWSRWRCCCWRRSSCPAGPRPWSWSSPPSSCCR